MATRKFEIKYVVCSIFLLGSAFGFQLITSDYDLSWTPQHEKSNFHDPQEGSRRGYCSRINFPCDSSLDLCRSSVFQPLTNLRLASTEVETRARGNGVTTQFTPDTCEEVSLLMCCH